MADEDDSQKTEDPTAKKLSNARSKGQVASSQEVKSWFVLMAGAGGLIFMSPFVANEIRLISTPFIEQAHVYAFDFEALRASLVGMIIDIGLATAPFFALILIFAFGGNILQFGLLVAPEKIKPDPSKLSLIKGVQRMFSLRSIVEFTKGIMKLIVIAGLTMFLTIPMLEDVELLPAFSMGAILDRVQELVVVISIATVGVMMAIAALDFLYQKYAFTKQMRMSKQEVKDEHKQSEGDPLVKAKIRSLRQQRARERMMSNVPDADVVVTNPTHFAVALKYEVSEMAAPKLVAKGVDTLAFRIREVAEENDVPIVENPPLARALYAAVELDEEIPQEHFVAVAEVIGYVMRLKGKTLH